MGRLMRKANRAAPSRPRPTNRPTVMVTPERDTPGCRARAWPTPMTSASSRPTSSIVRLPRTPSARASSSAPDDHHHGDEPDLVGVLLDGVGQQRAGYRRRHRRDRDQPAEPAVLRLAGFARGLGQAHDVVAEVGDRADQRAEVEGHVEGLLAATRCRRSRPSRTATGPGGGGPTTRSGGTRRVPG